MINKYRIITLIPSIIATSLIWCIEPMDGLNDTSIHVLAVFIGYFTLFNFRFVIALLISPYEMSSLISLSLCILALTKNFLCQTVTGNYVECKLCDTEEFQCESYKVS